MQSTAALAEVFLLWTIQEPTDRQTGKAHKKEDGLPDQPQNQLNLTRRASGRRDETSGSQRRSFGIVELLIQERRLKIRFAREIEYFGAKLQPRRLRNDPQGKIAIHRVIQFSESRWGS